MEHVSIGRKLPFALLKLELWRCWREHWGVYYAGDFVYPYEVFTLTRATDYVAPLFRPTVDIIVAVGIMESTPRRFSWCWGGFFPDIVPLHLKQF